ncbi:MAG: Hsp20/alpha crystallin family protein [Armatimonadota bacterium]|nr:Hsp20/alpha crystallin family protein [Armatimonadota bacterium]
MRRRTQHPLREIRALTERLREAMALSRRRRPARPSAWQPPMDLRATEDAYILELDLPGARREDVAASAEDGVLRVRGEVRLWEDLQDARRVRAERPMGRFARSIRLPSDADTTEITATLADGVLTICVGRRQKGGRIDIQIGS